MGSFHVFLFEHKGNTKQLLSVVCVNIKRDCILHLVNKANVLKKAVLWVAIPVLAVTGIDTGAGFFYVQRH
jgi:hypothetical protein